MEYKRAERVAELLKEEISRIIQTEVRDPRVSLSTITSVEMSDDLKHAKIYFVCDPKKQKSTKDGFDKSTGFIKKILASRLTLRYMPNIYFHYDTSLDYSLKIEGLLKKVKAEERHEEDDDVDE